MSVNLDTSETVFIVFEIKPNILRLTRAMKVFKIKLLKALFSFHKENFPNIHIERGRKCH